MLTDKQERKIEFNTRTIVIISMLTAIEIVLSRFLSFSVWNMKIGFAFMPVVLAAMLFGPVQAGIVGALGDFIGALLFPIGSYFPGFTLTAFLTGVVFGVFLSKKQTMIRIIAAVGVNQLVLSLLMNTLWIAILYGAPFGGLLPVRAIQSLVLIPVQIAGTLVLCKLISKSFFKRALV